MRSKRFFFFQERKRTLTDSLFLFPDLNSFNSRTPLN